MADDRHYDLANRTGALFDEGPASTPAGVPLTTGSCAAAAAQAAARWLWGETAPVEVCLVLPRGEKMPVPVKPLWRKGQSARCLVVKPCNQDADVTAGMPVEAQVTWEEKAGVSIVGGPGVGRVTLPGLQVPPGDAAINPVPRQLIADNVSPYLPSGLGARVEVSLPGGKDLARRTMNARLGIEGGLSVLGTSGLVRPMSWDSYTDSLLPQVDVALARGFRQLVLVPGLLGQKWTVALGIPAGAVIQTSNFIGPMLEAAADRGATAIVLAAHIGKLAKVAAGSFFTHNRTADGRLEVLAALAGKVGAPPDLLGQLLEAPSAETAAAILQSRGCNEVFALLAQRAARRCREYVDGRLETSALVFNLQGKVLGRYCQANASGGEWDCQLHTW